MGRTITFDIETNYLLNEDGIDYSSMPYKLKDDFTVHCICAQDVKTKEEFSFVQTQCKSFINFLRDECTYIIQYNGIDFDLMVLRLYFGMEYEIQPLTHKRLNINDPYEQLPDKLFDKPVRFLDLLILSKLLNPDRNPGHSLEDWGKTLHFYKDNYGKKEDAWIEYSQEMLSYCQQDVRLTTEVYNTLLKEACDYDWRESYDLEMCVRDIVSSKSQHVGFKLDQKLANWCVKDLQTKMKEIEERVEVLLPDRALPNNKQISYPNNVWKKPFDENKIFKLTGGLSKPVSDYLDKINIPEIVKEDYICSMMEREEVEGNTIIHNYIINEIEKHPSLLNTHAINFGIKIGITDLNELFLKILKIESGEEEVPIIKEKMTLRHKSDVKIWLCNQGWIPTNFNERDLTEDSNKNKRNRQQYEEAANKYVEETLNSVYCKYRCEFLKTTKNKLKEVLLNKKINRSVKVRTTPKYTKNQDKDLCDGLIRLGEQFSFVEDIVKWLTYDHRLNTIKSPNGTGWLNDRRLKQDWHISTPADTIGAITGRFKHRKVVNVPRSTSIYGEYMRGMLMVDDNCYQIGFDADGLEARAEAALVFKYPGGEEYVKKLIGKKPNDLHTINAKKFGISRDESKTLKYSSGYGAAPPKIAQQTGWSIEKAKKELERYWEEAKPAKLLIENITKHWESNSKEYIIGIDKRKLIARSPHVLFNLALQNLGIVCMKRAHIFTDRWMKEEGLLCDPFKNDLSIEQLAVPIIMVHDEQQQSVNKALVRLKYFDTKEEADEYKKHCEATKNFILSDIGKGFEKQYLDKYFVGWSRIGELMVKGLIASGEYYNLPIPLTSGYQIGKRWVHCH